MYLRRMALGLFVAGTTILGAATSAPAATKPNIVFILADDK
jgi:hypothetical protein